MINPADLVAANTTLTAGVAPAALDGTATALAAPTLDVAEPITLGRAKEHLRVVVADDDAYISSLIVAARKMAEDRLNRTIVQRRRVATFSGWGVRGYAGCHIHPLHLPKPPVISVDNVGYLGGGYLYVSGDETMLDATAFYMPLVDDDEMPRVEIKEGTVLPVLAKNRHDAVRVYYTAGYPVGEVPAPIIQWMLLVIGTMYDNRESVVTGVTSVALADNFAKWLLQPYMVYE